MRYVRTYTVLKKMAGRRWFLHISHRRAHMYGNVRCVEMRSAIKGQSSGMLNIGPKIRWS